MVEDSTTIDVERAKKEKNYIEVVVRQFKPILFGILSCVCLILASLEIVAGIFFIVSLTFFLLTIVMIGTSNKRDTKKIKLN